MDYSRAAQLCGCTGRAGSLGDADADVRQGTAVPPREVRENRRETLRKRLEEVEQKKLTVEDLTPGARLHLRKNPDMKYTVESVNGGVVRLSQLRFIRGVLDDMELDGSTRLEDLRKEKDARP